LIQAASEVPDDEFELLLKESYSNVGTCYCCR